MLMDSNVDLMIIVSYLVLTLAIGIWKGRGIKSMSEYAVADRNYTMPVLVATVAATWYNGYDTIGISEKVFSLGVIYMMIPIFNFVAKLFIGYFVAPNMKKFKKAISVGDVMESLYGKYAKVITGLAGVVLSVGYVGIQIAATGYVLNYFVNIDINIAIVIGSAIVVAYSAFGGIKSVTATDIIQFAVVIVIIPIVATIAVSEAGGYQNITEQVDPKKLTIFIDGITGFEIFMTLMIFMIPFLDPAIVQRLLMAKNLNKVASSFRIVGFIDIIFYFLVGSIGLSALVINPEIDPNNTFLFIIDKTLPVGIKGFAIVGLLALIMSTSDSYLNVASVSMVHDTIKPFVPNLSEKKALFFSKITTVVFGIGGIMMAVSKNSIVEMAFASLDLWAPIVVVPLILGILGLRASSKTFYSTSVVSIIGYLILSHYSTLNILSIGNHLLPSLILSAVAFILFYLVFDNGFVLFKTRISQLNTK